GPVVLAVEKVRHQPDVVERETRSFYERPQVAPGEAELLVRAFAEPTGGEVDAPDTRREEEVADLHEVGRRRASRRKPGQVEDPASRALGRRAVPADRRDVRPDGHRGL